MFRKWFVPILIIVCILFATVQIVYILHCLLDDRVAVTRSEDGYLETAALPGEEDVVIRSASLEADCLTFTCNVDWGTEVLPQMLDIFAEKGVKVTFFVSGRWAENNPKLLRKMYLMGHEIQSHGYGHKLCSDISGEQVKEEIEKTAAPIEALLGITPTVFAPPAGDYDEKTLDICREMGYKVSLWSSDTVDWREGSTADVIKKRILSKQLAGAIVLMHPKEETVKALPDLIDEIRSRGIEIVPLCEMGFY